MFVEIEIFRIRVGRKKIGINRSIYFINMVIVLLVCLDFVKNRFRINDD